MGTNSKASHAVYAIAPTAGGVVPAEAVDAPAEEYPQHLIGVIAHEETAETDAEEALEKLAVLAAGGDPEGPPEFDFASTADHYDAVTAAAEDVIAAAGALDPEQANALQQKTHELCRQFLAGLEHEDLLDLAGKNGFQYPELASLDETAPSPLTFWLDPAAADDEQKKTIQAIALNRHALLIAGGSVGGKTVGEWYPAAPETLADNTFAAHLAEVAQHQQQGGAALASSIAALIDEENKFVAAHASPELIEAHRSQVDAALTAVTWDQLAPAIAQAQASGSLDDTATQVLGPHQMLKLLRTSTPSAEHTDLIAIATARTDQLKSASALAEELKGLAAGQPPALGASGGEQAALELLAKTRDLNQLVSEMGAWNSLAPAPDYQSTLKPCHAALAGWLKEQKLTELREFLTHNGILDNAAKMSRSKLLLAVQQHIGTDKTMAGALATTIKGQNKPTAPSPTAKPTSFVYMAANPKSAFGHQHAQMVAALRAAQSAQTATPQPVDAAAVENWDFGSGKPAALGGTHPKTVHTGPDGRTWLAKREGTPRDGAVTHAEAAASRMLARAGLPCVPVYASKIDGIPVSLQPMLTGAKEMSTQPGSWTQADVDSLVRLHVANWALGNHDGHSGNVLRTNDGGLVPIDLGQAFKNFGRDKLSLDYRPYTNPLHHMAYDAHLKGGLAKGVRVDPSAAHPVIRSIESIPDVEWRAMMHEAAHRGASQAMKWSQPMRARAAKKHGVPESAVTKDQIAEALLDTAVERKNNLRKDFVQFFTKELQLSSASALQYLGKS
ncbi:MULTISPECIES: hypothetical protein [Amycolatopsis]|uniref:Uncharacterized protein n=1 Tax=Amycolatopsis echigonensis TaxID=2576905 RepID=A0A8E1VUE5_9PSEU|nr:MULTISPECIES: hypothetical protein [Amycolatopsis]MBB2498474.1 hypothetical protein [Amycolatopsis echigonensis]